MAKRIGKRTIILEHYQNPKNRGLIQDNTYKITLKDEKIINFFIR